MYKVVLIQNCSVRRKLFYQGCSSVPNITIVARTVIGHAVLSDTACHSFNLVV